MRIFLFFALFCALKSRILLPVAATAHAGANNGQRGGGGGVRMTCYGAGWRGAGKLFIQRMMISAAAYNSRSAMRYPSMSLFPVVFCCPSRTAAGHLARHLSTFAFQAGVDLWFSRQI